MTAAAEVRGFTQPDQAGLQDRRHQRALERQRQRRARLPMQVDYYPSSNARAGKLYVLQLTGNCLEPVIHDGDFALVAEGLHAHNGDFAVLYASNSDATMPIIKRMLRGTAAMLEAVVLP